MKLGSMVHDRAWVWIAMLFSNACLRFGNATKYGPVENIASGRLAEGSNDDIVPFHADRPPCTTAVAHIVENKLRASLP